MFEEGEDLVELFGGGMGEDDGAVFVEQERCSTGIRYSIEHPDVVLVVEYKNTLLPLYSKIWRDIRVCSLLSFLSALRRLLRQKDERGGSYHLCR